MSSFSPESVSGSHECDPAAKRELNHVMLVEDRVLPTSQPLAECRAVLVNGSGRVSRDLLDSAISHIYLAGLLIQTRCEGSTGALVDELTRITDDLDVAIHQLQAAALANHDASTSSETALTNR
jgi:hypothetical protein